LGAMENALLLACVQCEPRKVATNRARISQILYLPKEAATVALKNMHKKCSTRKLEKCQPRQRHAPRQQTPPPPSAFTLYLYLDFFSGENLESACAKAKNKNVSAAFCRLCGARPNFPSGWWF